MTVDERGYRPVKRLSGDPDLPELGGGPADLSPALLQYRSQGAREILVLGPGFT